MRSVRRLTSMLLAATLLVAGIAPGVAAQDASPVATPSPMCNVLTAQEISDALGVTVAITDSSDDGCNYGADTSAGDYFIVASNRTGDGIEAIKQAFTGESLTVGGQDALFVADTSSPLLFVGTPDGGSYSLMVVGTLGKGVDAKTALTGLGELALTRLADVPAITPGPSARPLEGATDLEALVPGQIGGVDVSIQSMSGNDLVASGSVPAEFTAALSGMGKTINDVRMAIAYTTGATTPSSIIAVQVVGADAAALQDAFMPSLAQGKTIDSQTTVQIAGKDVTAVTIGDQTTYVYPRNDILWVVNATEPALTEIFQKLP